ncbi:Hypothetical predicted protein [Mytilus galloprovincialis]|uniref:Uncharacterized protein n=1 Tax=Mytilus galloprovincialis TaxID=29158 RepID=A0A8B6GMF0_MYTGA|nr:Hypothetical predicted protein [Mytilus galloprovincialis]
MISYDIGCRILGKTSTIYYCCRPLDVLTRKCEVVIISGDVYSSTNQLITGEHITPITEKTAKDSKNEGFLNKESGVYFGSFGLLSFLKCILMAYICYKKGKRKAGSNLPKQNPDELEMETKCLVYDTKGEMITNENDYEEIDERYLSDIKSAVNQEKEFKEKEKDQQDIVESKATIDNKGLKHDYTECEDLHIVESKPTIDNKDLKHDYTECKDLDIVESKATIDNTDLKHDNNECEDLQRVEALTSNTKEDDADK